MAVYRAPSRFRQKRFVVLTSLLALFAVYHLFLSSPSELPEELINSPLFHAPEAADPDSTTAKGTKWSRARAVLDARNLGFGRGEALGLAYDDDGLVKGWKAAHELLRKGGLGKREKKRLKEIRDTHPIEELMVRGKERWEALLARQSKTLPQAVTEYTRRYKRPPPKGFEVWWQFCKKHGVRIVDDYDQIQRDIEPYFALSPKEFQKRAAALDAQEHSYQITLSPHSPPTLTGPRAQSARGRHLFHLLAPLSSLLPIALFSPPSSKSASSSPSALKITVSDHDMGNWLLGADQLDAARELVKRKKYFTEEQLKELEKKERGQVKGILSACQVGSRGWKAGFWDKNAKEEKEVQKEEQEVSFIHDPYPTYDLCSAPSLLQTHGSHSFPFPRESKLRPLFQLSKFSRDPSFLTTPLEAYDNHTSDAGAAKYAPWEEKTVDKLFWRGSATGDHYSHRKGYDWRKSHRPRLHFLAQETEGQSGVWVERGKEWSWEQVDRGKVNEVYMDVGLTGKPHQCSKDDGTCDEMQQEIQFLDRIRPEDAVKYKYVLDVDGNGWSSRFHRLLLSGSMVIKATIYQEWQSDWMIPWYHYVPAQIDYSDLYSILSFFIGPPEGKKGGHDDLARLIAEQGRKFGIEHWRWEDMQAYMFRLLLEYARLGADDRQAASYLKTYT